MFYVGDGFALCSVLASELLVVGSLGSHDFADRLTLWTFLLYFGFHMLLDVEYPQGTLL